MHINIAISTLRELTIRFNMLSEDIHDDMTVMIDTANLLYLRCKCDPTIQFIPVNLTSIVDAHIDLGFLYPPNELFNAECAIELLSGLSNVKSLNLANDTLEVCLMICSPSSFFFLCEVFHQIMPDENVVFSYVFLLIVAYFLSHNIEHSLFPLLVSSPYKGYSPSSSFV